MIVSQKNNNFNKFVFLTSLFMLILRKYLAAFFGDYVLASKVQSLLLYIPILLLIVQFIINKFHTKKEVYMLVGLMVLYLLTRDGSILIFILMAFGILAIEDRFVVKSYFNIHILLLMAIVFIAIFNQDFVSFGGYHYKWEDGVRVLRENFGLANPNAAFYYLLPIYAAYIYLRFDKYNVLDRILMIGLTILVYSVTASRTGFIAVAGGLVLVEILRLIDLNKFEFIAKYIKYIPIAFATISILVGTIFHEIELLNKMLSSRPKNWYIYLISRGNMFSLFGNEYTPGVRNKNPMDNSYIYILCFLGVIAFILLMYITYKVLDKYVKENKKKYIAISMLFFVYGIAENILLEVSLNFTLLLMIKEFLIGDNSSKINIYNLKNYNSEVEAIKQVPSQIKKVKDTVKNKINRKNKG